MPGHSGAMGVGKTQRTVLALTHPSLPSDRASSRTDPPRAKGLRRLPAARSIERLAQGCWQESEMSEVA